MAISKTTSRMIIGIPLVILLIAVGLTAFIWNSLFQQYTHPERVLGTGSPADYSIDYQEISIDSKDSFQLSGWLMLPEIEEGELPPLVIAVHGYGTDKWDILDRCSYIVKAGFAVIDYDQRGRGESGGVLVSGGVEELDDLRKVIAFAKNLTNINTDQIMLYGFSMGGVLVIHAGADDSDIKLIVADAPYASIKEITEKILSDEGLPIWPFIDLFGYSFRQTFGLDMETINTVAAVSKLAPRPLLMVGGDQDKTVPPAHVAAIFAAAGEPKELVIYPGHDHLDNGSKEIFDTVILPFMQKYSKQQDSVVVPAEMN
jgi:cephalosporin-C deacetylase-like acetyl esterase